MWTVPDFFTAPRRRGSGRDQMNMTTKLLRLTAPALLLLLSSTCADRPVPIDNVVTVTGGDVRGRAVDGSTVRVWEGVPYAAPPVGDLRWKPPAPVEAWESVREAPAGVSQCVQSVSTGGFYDDPDPAPQDEDCLYLNVWSAARAVDEARPVMVWIHGGGLVFGDGSRYNGGVLAEKGVVVITINYRLGPFGFTAHPGLSAESPHSASGNYGFLDQIAALEWVRDNVRNFGGNPNRVTIFGESAGSLSVNVMQASPLARGLFHGVIGESGGSFHPMAYLGENKPWADSAESLGVGLAKAAGVTGENDAEILAALRAMSAQKVFDAFESDSAFSNYWVLGQVDGHVLPAEIAEIYAEGRQTDVPVMIGSNADEGTSLADVILNGSFGVKDYREWVEDSHPELASEIHELYPASNDDEAWQAYADLIGDEWFTYHARQWVRDMDNVSSPAYLYLFSYGPPVEQQDRYGAFHAGEIGYVFGKLDLFGATPGPADKALSEVMSDAWVRFAATSDPNGPGLERWEPFTSSNEAYMDFGAAVAAGRSLRMEKVDLIRRSFEARRARLKTSSGTAAGSR